MRGVDFLLLIRTTATKFQINRKDGPHRMLTLPPYAPELNPIENVWAYLRANCLAISVFEIYQEIVTQCCDAWNFFVNDVEAVKSITTRDYAKTVKG